MWIGTAKTYRDLPHLSDADAIIPLLANIATDGASDISFKTNEPVLVRQQGRWHSITAYRLNNSQLERILKKITKSENVIAKLSGGEDYDTALTIDDYKRRDAHGDPIQHRFRLNATADYSSGPGFHAMLRVIPSEPPTLDAITFPSQLRDLYAIEQGSLLIAGDTGSGKTTTMAAGVRHILEGDTPIKGCILTFEAPIEFLFDKIPSTHSFVSQVEIGTHLRSFPAAVRNAMRRKPAIILFGELRDAETIGGAIEASLTGHPFFGTTHGNSCLEIFERLIQPFPIHQHEMVFANIVRASRLLMSQSLVRSDLTEKLICLRDWVYLTNADKERIRISGLKDYLPVLRSLIADPVRGRTMRTSIDLAHQEGHFDDRQVQLLYRKFGVEE